MSQQVHPAPFTDGWEMPAAPVQLCEEGLRLQLVPGRSPSALIPYADVTHVAAVPRGLWLATRRTTSLLRRRHFRDENGPEALERVLMERIAALPQGSAQLARFAAADRMQRHPHRRLVAPLVLLACLILYLLELRDPFVEEVGAFVPELVRHGQLWRLATANFLHGVMPFHLHLVVNAACLLGFALVVERPLGALATALILGASGIGAMLGSGLASDSFVVGASGMVAGLAGAALYLELRHPHRLPASWRLPRRLFITALLVDGALGFVLPMIAGAAHLGGFLAGYATASWLAGRALSRQRVPRLATATVAVLVVGLLLAFGSLAGLVTRDAGSLSRYARGLLQLEEVWPLHFNDVAWRMATETSATPEQLQPALALAERAVAETDRANPDLLDTLAELRFSTGDRAGAIATIDEAISLARGQRYFREQRRRFTGERRASDRPAPPELPWPYYSDRVPNAPDLADGEDGIAI